MRKSAQRQVRHIEGLSSNEVIGRYGQTSPHPIYTYSFLYDAYNHFRAELFDGQLPDCLITVQRHRGAYGYFSPDRFARTDNGSEIAHEIALNPEHFDCESEFVLSVLAHEMAHLYQHEHGRPGRGGYHNRQFAQIMKSRVGLMPSATGKPGGAQIGDRMGHYIVEGGAFDLSSRRFLASHEPVLYRDRAVRPASNGSDAPTPRQEKLRKRRESKNVSKSLYCCPFDHCPLNVWAKPGVWIICGRHKVDLRSNFTEFDPFDETVAKEANDEP